MESFAKIEARAAARKGGAAALEEALTTRNFGIAMRPASEIAAMGDDRILSRFSRHVFAAGFNWKVIDAKWPGFEAAFHGFDIRRNAMMSDDDLDAHLSNKAIVRHAAKILSVRDNAIFLSDLAKEHGGAARLIGEWPATDHVGLLALLKARGARLGGTTAQYALRALGKESFVLTPSVTAALIAAGVVDRAPTSKSAMAKVQAAFNAWMDESGAHLTRVSKTLALSVE